VMLKYGVTHRLSTAYHPQTSGQVEAFRTTLKTPIGYTPYKLVYEKACHLPIELEHKAYWALKHCNFDLKTAGDHRKVQMNELNKPGNLAYENSLIYKEKTKKIHDSKIKNRIFNVGDRVLLFNSRLKIFSGKLKTRCTGPFTIAQVFPYRTIIGLESDSEWELKAASTKGKGWCLQGFPQPHRRFHGWMLPKEIWEPSDKKDRPGKARVDGKPVGAFVNEKVEMFNCHKYGHFARECKFKGSKEGSRQEAGKGQKFQASAN
ncbi:reverse transcriptase domain-containing protein, partial [Tanacetum coccineum]